MNYELNNRAGRRLEAIIERCGELQIVKHEIAGGGRFFDFGISSVGGLHAGVELARMCLSDLATVQVTTIPLFGGNWPTVEVATDHPVEACLYSQYAGWQIKTETFFGMGSGPMRAAAAREPLFEKLGYQESADHLVGVLETNSIPDRAVFEFIAERSGVAAEQIDLLGAPVCSPAGSLQVVARSVETALHKLFELGFDVHRVESGFGTAPLPPVAKGDLNGIGRTNDAILYGATVSLWVIGDDESLQTIGPKVPAESSPAYGQPFVDIFEAADRDFYKIDPHLFSPAVVILQNLETGNVFTYGRTDEDVLQRSFGI